MKKYNFILVLLFLFKMTVTLAQTGIMTNSAVKDAVLDLNNTNGTNTKGLVLPKIALIATNNFAPLSAHIPGMHIWNTASTGSGINAVIPGEYYNDGTKWIRISFDSWSQNGNVNTTPGTNFVGTTDNVDLVLKTANTEKMRISANGKIGIGINPIAKLDLRPLPSSTNNPGAGFIGIGTTNVLASTAGAGAIRYSTNSGGGLEFSDGVVWNRLPSTVSKTVVMAKKITPQSFVNAPTGSVTVTDWLELEDNNNAFDPTTGIFTAPRTGLYTIAFAYDFLSNKINSGGQVEAIIKVIGDNSRTKKGIFSFPVGGNSQAGSSVTFVVNLNAGDRITSSIWHNTGFTQTLRVGPIGSTEDGFNNFSVGEL